MKECEFLKIISKNLDNTSYLGDDCAYLEEYNLVLSTDTLVEDVHFSFDFMNIKEVAKKAMLVNISDILASGAKPNYALISLSGKLDNNFIDEFYSSLNEISKKYDLKIIGGDLTGGNKISITITILGNTKERNISKRSNAKVGYTVGVIGKFGNSAKGLKELFEGKKETSNIKIHKEPKLYPLVSKIIATTAKKPYAMMDSSDGLFDCLKQISEKSKVKIQIDYNKIPKNIKEKELVLYGGEDYNLVFALDENDFKEIKKHSKDIFQIGKCLEGSGVFIDNEEIKENRSFKHFE